MGYTGKIQDIPARHDIYRKDIGHTVKIYR